MLLFVGCSLPALETDTAVAEPDVVDTAASIEILWPPEETEVTACTIMLVELHNFMIRDYEGDPPDAPGEGHYHIYYGTTFTGCYAPYCLVDLSGLPDDGYILTAELAANEHDAVLDANGAPIQDSVAINLTAGTCEATLAGLP